MMRYHENNAIEAIKESLLRMVESMDPTGMSFVLQLACLILFPCILCWLVTVNDKSAAPWRLVTALIVGMMTAMFLPVSEIPIDRPSSRLCAVTATILAATFGPRVLANMIIPTAGPQKKLTIGLYVTVIALSIWQHIRGF